MELITSIRKAIDYMEKHLTDNISVPIPESPVYICRKLRLAQSRQDQRIKKKRASTAKKLKERR